MSSLEMNSWNDASIVAGCVSVWWGESCSREGRGTAESKAGRAGKVADQP